MKVLISGYYGFYNAGDEAILKSIIQALRQINPDINIVVLSNDVEYTKKTYNVNAINRWNLPKIYKELKSSNGLISGGGSLLQDVTSCRPVIYYITIMELAKLAKKPTFIYAQGVGPVNSNINRKLIKKVLNKVEYISLRDNESLELLRYIGITKDIQIVPDPVMGFNIEDKSDDFSKSEDYITVSIREWDGCNNQFLEKIAKTCDEIVKLNKEVVFVPMHGEHDYNVSKKIINMMKYDAKVLDYKSSIEEKVLCIESSKLMIGMRLHALIFAAKANTPMVGISYDPKIESFLKLVEQKCIGSVTDGWSYKDLVKVVENILENEEYIRKNLKEKADELNKKAESTAMKALNVFQNNGIK